MKHKIRKFLLLLLILPAVGCVRVEDLSYDGIESVKVQSLGGSQSVVDLFVRASNASGSNISVIKAEMSLSKEQRTLLRASVDEKVKLPRKFDGVIRIPVKIRFEGGILGAIGVMGTLAQGVAGTTVSGTVVVKAGLIRKKYEVKDMETERFLRQFGIQLPELMKSFQ